MAGRGPQSFKKRQKEQARKEKHQEKIAKRLERKRQGSSGLSDETPVSETAEEWSPPTADSVPTTDREVS